MADKQFARSGTGDFDLLADDDPLSELARIVGYDNRPAVQQLQEIEKQQLLVRREPVFNLEDELSREFELYDAPAAVSHEPARVADVPPLELAEEPVFEAAPVEELASPEAYDRSFDEVVYDAPVVLDQDEPAADPVEPVSFAEDHAAEDEISADRAPENDYSVDPVARYESHEPSFDAIVHSEPTFDVEPVEMNWVPEPALEIPQQDDGDFVVADLERELELSIGYDEAAATDVDAPVPAEPVTGFDMEYLPVAEHAPVVEQVAVEQEVPVAAEADEHLAAVEDHAAPAENPFAAEPWDIPEPAADAVIETPVPSDDPNDIDALLADIERFPVPEMAVVKATPVSVNPPETVRKNNYPFTPTFSRATPTASLTGSSVQKAFAMPLTVAPAAAATLPDESVEAEPDVLDLAVVANQPPAHEAEAEPDFDLDNFELDLSDIDMDLELDPAEFTIETAPVEDNLPVAPATETREPVAQEPVTLVVPPFVTTEEAFDGEDDGADSVLPFDPSMISETEENVTAIADLHVPHLPVVEKEKPVAYQPDYDLDIDAEIAQLFGNGGHKAPVLTEQVVAGQGFAASAHAIPVTHASVQPSGVRANEEFDEFEKAMEEDFRLSISQRQDNDAVNDRLAVGGDYGTTDFDEDKRSGGRRLGMIAAAVGGLLILGGVGVYAWMGGSGAGLASTDPKIILADKSPVKMVPVEKGGKTVPNQDKAVYDRVAGAPAEAVQQGTLVSSTEEPVDVVQRTLTPESLPLEGAEDFDGADVTPIDDESARLLPDGEQPEAKANGEDRATAVSPRKVRTMIVKPDGTLVAREEPAPEVVEEVASTETPATANVADPQVKTVKTTTVTPQVQAEDSVATQSETATAAQTDLRTQEQPAAEQSALAEAANASVDETAPVRTVKTTTIGEQAPVPQTRPAEQPVNVVGTVTDQGNVKPAEVETTTVAVAETTPVQTASVPAGAYVIQIASLPSEAEAQQSYTKLSGKFASVIGGRGSDIRKAEIAGKGTYYRVRIPAGSRQDANALCSRYKSAGGSCLVTK